MVKICGLTNAQEIEWATSAGADLIGMVVFFPKSKRNISIDLATELIASMPDFAKPVAVCVEPDLAQIREIEDTNFSYVQIHGKISEELINQINIPVIKAFNVSDFSDFERFKNHPKVAGFVFDAGVPGSGVQFDYSLLKDFGLDKYTEKFVLLAGGLNPDNVREALLSTRLLGADTSSGVENTDAPGKNRDKVFRFVANAKQAISENRA